MISQTARRNRDRQLCLTCSTAPFGMHLLFGQGFGPLGQIFGSHGINLESWTGWLVFGHNGVHQVLAEIEMHGMFWLKMVKQKERVNYSRTVSYWRIWNHILGLLSTCTMRYICYGFWSCIAPLGWQESSYSVALLQLRAGFSRLTLWVGSVGRRLSGNFPFPEGPEKPGAGKLIEIDG